MFRNVRLFAGLMSVGCLALLIGLSGCSGSQRPTAKVSGKVTHDGKPVEGGSVTFAPIADGGEAGKPASGEIKSDGSYSLGTYAPGDGAVIGRHRVMFSPPSGGAAPAEGSDDGEHDETPPPSPYVGLKPKEAEVEVKAGDNVINIELVGGAATGEAAETSN